MKLLKKSFGVAMLFVLLNMLLVSFAEASFLKVGAHNGHMKSVSKFEMKVAKITGTNNEHIGFDGNSSNTDMYFTAEPGRVEYCFHQDVNLLGHKFSLDSHTIAGIGGFSHSTSSYIDKNGGYININHDKANCNTGSLSGIVYYDANKNDQYDEGETGAKGIEIVATDEDGYKITVTTDDSGRYHIANILEGTVSVLVKTSTLPKGTIPNNSVDNPNIVNVKAHEDNDAGKYGYIDKCGCGKGSLTGMVYYDENGNNKYDDGEEGTDGIEVVITDKNGEQTTVTTDDEGVYHVEGIPVGEASVYVKPDTLPEGTMPNNSINNPHNIDVQANEDNDAGKYGYIKKCGCGKGNLTGMVYYDKNGNNKYDDGEEGTSGIEVVITDKNGEQTTVTTDDEGVYHVEGIPVGEASVYVKPDTLPEGTMPNNSINNPHNIDVQANEDNDAGKYGYINKCGRH